MNDIFERCFEVPFSGSTGAGRTAYSASRAQRGSKEDDLIPEKYFD